MARIRRFIRHLRLIVVVLLLSGLTPGSHAAPARLTPLQQKLSALSGTVWIVIQKSRHVLTLYKGMTPVKSYWAAFGKGYSAGDKRTRGDQRTPEGEFYICTMNHSPRFYKFMGLSYPGLRHAALGLALNLITPREYNSIQGAISEGRQPPWDTQLGGAIGIHGRVLDKAVKGVPRPENWTDGCIALNNHDVDEVFDVVSLGTPVTIIP
jgi:murein L,D-transpeptidase YafK